MTTNEDRAQDLLDNEVRELLTGVAIGELPLRAFTERLDTMTEEDLVRVIAATTADIARLKALLARGAAMLDRNPLVARGKMGP